MKSFILCASIFLMAAANASPYDLGSSGAHGPDDQGHQIKVQFREDEAKNLTNKHSEIDTYDVDVDEIHVEDRYSVLPFIYKTLGWEIPTWHPDNFEENDSFWFGRGYLG